MMEKKKKILLIDQDDVLAEYIEGVAIAYNKKYNTSKTAEDCTCWDLYAVFGNEVDTVMHDPELFRHLKPVKYALEVFERLYKSELFEMYIVTAAQSTTVEAKHEWIKTYLPYFPQEQIIVCRKKGMIRGDFLLDDGMHNIEEFAASGGTPIIFDRPHNRNADKGYMRVKDWLEFERKIVELCYPQFTYPYFDEVQLDIV